MDTNYEVRVVELDLALQLAIAEAHRAHDAARDALILARVPASGTAEMEVIARTEKLAMADLEDTRTKAIKDAEGVHRERLAALRLAHARTAL